LAWCSVSKTTKTRRTPRTEIAQNVTELDTSNQALWVFSKQAAGMIGMDHKYFSEKFIFESKDFPKAFRFTPAGRRRWLRTEILKWIKSKREAA